MQLVFQGYLRFLAVRKLRLAWKDVVRHRNQSVKMIVRFKFPPGVCYDVSCGSGSSGLKPN